MHTGIIERIKKIPKLITFDLGLVVYNMPEIQRSLFFLQIYAYILDVKYSDKKYLLPIKARKHRMSWAKCFFPLILGHFDIFEGHKCENLPNPFK